jgi:perosamine synthetase
LREGDEVLVPSYHCGSELEVLAAHRLALRFYPVSANLRTSVDDVEAARTKSTRAVYVTHFLGLPTDIVPIAEHFHARGLYVIEDCAQALYSSTPSGPVGSFGDLGIFSLRKFLPVRDGGALVERRAAPSPSDSESTVQESRAPPLGGTLSEQASVADQMSEVSQQVFHTYDHEFAAAARRTNYMAILAGFSSIREATPLWHDLEDGCVPLLFPVLVDSPVKLVSAMNAHRIEAFEFWPHAHRAFSLVRPCGADRLRGKLAALPLHQQLSSADIDRIVDGLRKTFGG